jgi:hypothetical protein
MASQKQELSAPRVDAGDGERGNVQKQERWRKSAEALTVLSLGKGERRGGPKGA